MPTLVKLFTLFCFQLMTWKGFGQPFPIATGYLASHQLINPAYAGISESAGILLAVRKEYLGFSSSPQSQTLVMHTPLFNEYIGLGIQLSQEWQGRENRTTLMVDYAYEVMLWPGKRLRFGMKTGIANYHNALSRLQLFPTAVPDPVFIDNHHVRNLFNLGVGVFYYEKKRYAGISIPKMIISRPELNPENYTFQYGLHHIYVTGGFWTELPDGRILRPSVMIWGVPGENLTLDVSASLLLNKQLWVGGMLRTRSLISLFSQWHLNDQIKLGYAVDFGWGTFQRYHWGTHEITFGYAFDFYGRKPSVIRFF